MTFKKFIKSFDIYGSNISFHYKGVEKYYSFTGGCLNLTFLFCTLFSLFLSLSSFINKKNYFLIYYSHSLHQTDKISFSKYNSLFSFDIYCEDLEDQNEILNYFSFNVQYVNNYIDENGNNKQIKTNISLHNCTKNDYNNQNENIINKNYNHFCLDNINYTIEGIYSQEIFNYFMINVFPKNNSFDLYNNIEKFLLNNVCKINLNYLDTSIDINNYTNSINHFFDNKFLVLKHSNIPHMNIYFKILNFESDNNLFFDRVTKKYYISFSKFELYELDNNKEVNENENKVFANIFIRADQSRTIIKIRYEKFIDFLTNLISILGSLFFLLFIIISNLNKYYCKQAVMKRIFQFQNNKKSKSYNAVKFLRNKVKFENIKEGTNMNKMDSQISFKSVKITNLIRNANDLNILSPKKKNNFISNSLITKGFRKEKNIYHTVNEKFPKLNLKFHTNTNNNNINFTNYINNKNILNFNIKNISNFNNNNEKINTPTLYDNSKDLLTYNNNNTKNRIKIKKKSSFHQKKVNKNEINNSLIENTKREENLESNNLISNININKNEINNTIDNNSNINKVKKINNSKNEYDLTLPFTFCESILIFFFPCFSSKKLKMKYELFLIGQKKLFFQLDILNYLEKIQIVELCNYILLNPKDNKMIRFLAKPTINLNKSKDIYEEIFYDKKNLNNDLDEIYKYYQYLKKKKLKTQLENRLYKLAKKQMDNMLDL